MSGPLRVLMPSDVFPPRCGGAGWSAHTLALALIARGHAVTAIVPRRVAARHARAAQLEDVLGVPTVRVDYWAPAAPIVQNYFRHERLWPRLADALVDSAATMPAPGVPAPVIIHAQHVQAAPAAIAAGRRLRAPAIITVRDQWPWDYFSTGLHANRLPYPRQTWASLAADLPLRLGFARGVPALAGIPYMLAHLRRRQQALRQASAVIAVSAYIAGRLAPFVAPERLHVIPNMVDLAAVDAALAAPHTSLPIGKPYLLFVGKLERNKGAQLLIEVFRALRAQEAESAGSDGAHPLAAPELVIAGDGPLRPALEHELAMLGVRTRFLDWAAHDDVLRLMAGCELLLFPSAWGEPLSRVPLEAGACGAAVLAMPTGGTPDIIRDGVNGALEATTRGFARRMAALMADPAGRKALGAAARHTVEQRFSPAAVAPRVEALYRELAAAFII
ncbi:glycosyltransferase family 4 protein [Kouleothrix sp.]|uniref:glycosyltransferase family 4 protein n=1 Tax=Kouleothrix sp. TaxID=2779161 RepID=UPI00391AF123